ncbi:MAG: Hsp20 family protein [Gammaproteobacteria bacterium]|nr:Hsp20 family protein [Gammaproteobacteria bacterium]
MVNFDLSPLYRSTIGFDRLATLLDSARQIDPKGNQTYPPYNIERTGNDNYRISMAVAGFEQSELSVETKENTLSVTGTKQRDDNKNYLYQGIAERNFERRFQLEDHVKITNAKLENGLLHIELVREIPDAIKPRTINIQTEQSKVIENKQT